MRTRRNAGRGAPYRRRGRWRSLFVLLGLGLLALLATYIDTVLRNRDPLIGRPHVVDGDTLELDGARVRLEGIDAPELGQMCLASSGAAWGCGKAARDRLKSKTVMGSVRCVRDGFDRYLRTLAVCYAGDVDLNAALVRDGWALSLRRGPYGAEENEARTARRGLWAGAFIAPWNWRNEDKDADVLGALKGPPAKLKILFNTQEAR